MKRTPFTYESKNAVSNDFFYLEHDLENQPTLKDVTDLWLTKRYALIQDYKNHIIEYDVHHLEWPMQEITLKKLKLDYPKYNSLIHINPIEPIIQQMFKF